MPEVIQQIITRLYICKCAVMIPLFRIIVKQHFLRRFLNPRHVSTPACDLSSSVVQHSALWAENQSLSRRSISMQGFKYPKMCAGEQLIPEMRLQHTKSKKNITDRSNDLIIAFHSVSFKAKKCFFFILLALNVKEKRI